MQELPQAAGLPAEEPDLLRHPLHTGGDVLVVVEGDAEDLLCLAVRSSSATSTERLDDVLQVGRGADQEEEDDVVEVEAHLHLAGGDPQLDVTSQGDVSAGHLAYLGIAGDPGTLASQEALELSVQPQVDSWNVQNILREKNPLEITS